MFLTPLSLKHLLVLCGDDCEMNLYYVRLELQAFGEQPTSKIETLFAFTVQSSVLDANKMPLAQLKLF